MNRGVFLLLLAEFCFASATIFAKYVTNNVDVPALELTFFRVTIGTVAAAIYMFRTKTSFIPKKISWVLTRAIFSFAALIAFFYAVKHSSVTNANMLNMTYPVFIFLLAPLFKLERMKKVSFIFLVMAMAGIYLIIFPDFSNINKGDLIGLLSGIGGAIAIISLSMARKNDSTVLIVFYLMAIGTICNIILIIPVFVLPETKYLIALIICGILGLTGQVFLTMGYKFVTAKAGSMISSSRIVFAATLGFIFFSEPMTLQIITGGLLIISAIIGISALQKVVTSDE